nr:MAG TPA: hypothetical protein [Caudoviricetes sp.]
MGPDPLTTFLVLVVRGSFHPPGLRLSAWVCYACRVTTRVTPDLKGTHHAPHPRPTRDLRRRMPMRPMPRSLARLQRRPRLPHHRPEAHPQGEAPGRAEGQPGERRAHTPPLGDLGGRPGRRLLPAGPGDRPPARAHRLIGAQPPRSEEAARPLVRRPRPRGRRATVKKYQIDWVQFAAALITIGCLVGAIVAMFAMPRQPWPVTFPLLCVAALAGCVVDARMEGHGLRGIWKDREGRK